MHSCATTATPSGMGTIAQKRVYCPPRTGVDAKARSGVWGASTSYRISTPPSARKSVFPRTAMVVRSQKTLMEGMARIGAPEGHVLYALISRAPIARPQTSSSYLPAPAMVHAEDRRSKPLHHPLQPSPPSRLPSSQISPVPTAQLHSHGTPKALVTNRGPGRRSRTGATRTS